MGREVVGMIGNVHAEVVPQGPTQAEINTAMKFSGIENFKITKKDLARGALVFGTSVLTLACNATTWGINGDKIGFGLICAVTPLAFVAGLMLGVTEKQARGK